MQEVTLAQQAAGPCHHGIVNNLAIIKLNYLREISI